MNPLRKKLPLLATLLALFAAVAGYVIGMAYFQSRGSSFYTFGQLIKPRLVDVTIGSWLVYMGCAIGSFLNVVAWRMPRGEGINGSSHCPRCANKLKTRDNFPVLGWISLNGRCRFCSLPISRRYPMVEAVVGISLTLVGLTQLYWLALPGQLLHWHGGPLWAPRITTPILVIVTYHVVALSTLWAMALIRMDGVRIPSSIRVFSIITLPIPMLAYPLAMIVPWQTTRAESWSPVGNYIETPVRIATAIVAAAFFGRVLARTLCPRADLKLDPLGNDSSRLIDLIFMLSIPAVLIGWQSMPAIVVISAILSIFIRPLVNWIPINDSPKGQIESRGGLEYFSFSLPLVVTIQLAFWRPLWRGGFWPSDVSWPSVILLWAFAALIVPSFIPPDEFPAQPPNAVEEEAEDEELEDEELDSADSADELPNQPRDPEADNGD